MAFETVSTLQPLRVSARGDGAHVGLVVDDQHLQQLFFSHDRPALVLTTGPRNSRISECRQPRDSNVVARSGQVGPRLCPGLNV
jgi:hypothetical protein